MCRELNLENSVEELMRELGADEHGRISYQEFLRCRLALRPEIEALRSGKHRTSPHHTHTPEYLPTSSDNSLGEYLSSSNQSHFFRLDRSQRGERFSILIYHFDLDFKA